MEIYLTVNIHCFSFLAGFCPSLLPINYSYLTRTCPIPCPVSLPTPSIKDIFHYFGFIPQSVPAISNTWIALKLLDCRLQHKKRVSPKICGMRSNVCVVGALTSLWFRYGKTCGSALTVLWFCSNEFCGTR